MAFLSLFFALLSPVHAGVQHHVVSICFYGPKGEKDPIREECEKNVKDMEACGIKVHKVFQGPFKDEAERKVFLEGLAKRDRFPADADFLVDAHGDQKVELLRSIRTANEKEDGTTFHSDDGGKFASSREIFEAIEKTAPDAPVWVDACRAGGCAKVGKLRVGAACDLHEFSRMDAPFEKRIIKLLCHSQKEQCKEWYETDKNRDGVITAAELAIDFCSAFKKKDVTENHLISTKDDPKYFERIETLKRECADVDVKTGFLFEISGNWEEIDYSIRDSGPILKTVPDRPRLVDIPVPLTIKHDATFKFGVFESEEKALDAAKKLPHWNRGECATTDGFLSHAEATGRKWSSLMTQQATDRLTLSLAKYDADHSLTGCKLKKKNDDRYALAACKKTVPFLEHDSPGYVGCKQCPQLGGYALRSPNCRERAAGALGPHGITPKK